MIQRIFKIQDISKCIYLLAECEWLPLLFAMCTKYLRRMFQNISKFFFSCSFVTCAQDNFANVTSRREYVSCHSEGSRVRWLARLWASIVTWSLVNFYGKNLTSWRIGFVDQIRRVDFPFFLMCVRTHKRSIHSSWV